MWECFLFLSLLFSLLSLILYSVLGGGKNHDNTQQWEVKQEMREYEAQVNNMNENKRSMVANIDAYAYVCVYVTKFHA